MVLKKETGGGAIIAEDESEFGMTDLVRGLVD